MIAFDEDDSRRGILLQALPDDAIEQRRKRRPRHGVSGASDSDHDEHRSGAAQEALIVTADGVGDDVCITFSEGRGRTIRTKKRYFYPNSFGQFYSACTQILGFKAGHHEGKITGLAGFGNRDDALLAAVESTFTREDGFRLGKRYYAEGWPRLRRRVFSDLLGGRLGVYSIEYRNYKSALRPLLAGHPRVAADDALGSAVPVGGRVGRRQQALGRDQRGQLARLLHRQHPARHAQRVLQRHTAFEGGDISGVRQQEQVSLLLEVDVEGVFEEQLAGFVDSVRVELRRARIGYTGLGLEGDWARACKCGRMLGVDDESSRGAEGDRAWCGGAGREAGTAGQRREGAAARLLEVDLTGLSAGVSCRPQPSSALRPGRARGRLRRRDGDGGVLPVLARGVSARLPGDPRSRRGAVPCVHERLGSVERSDRTGRQGRLLRERVRRGRLLGGNLSVLAGIAGSPYLPAWDGAILFLEDVRELRGTLEGALAWMRDFGDPEGASDPREVSLERAGATCLAIPFHNQIPEADQAEVAAAVRRAASVASKTRLFVSMETTGSGPIFAWSRMIRVPLPFERNGAAPSVALVRSSATMPIWDRMFCFILVRVTDRRRRNSDMF